MFTANCQPILIGSLPLLDYAKAVQLILKYTPEIPLWPQLPKLPREGMIRQFLTGFPGLEDDGAKYFINTNTVDYPGAMATFYEDYLQAVSGSSELDFSRFALGVDTAPGFFALLSYLQEAQTLPLTVKGQITGPITTGIGVKDSNGSAIIYDQNLIDILIKLLSVKAYWQVVRLRSYCRSAQPIIFVDEPGLVSYGSTGFSGISRETANTATAEVINAIKSADGLAGVHICANGDWGPVLTSNADIISFDAYSYFDNFILYRQELTSFLNRGGILAWGIVPTGDPEAIAKASVVNLFEKWQEQLARLSSLGFAEKQLLSQTFIAPSCGTGSLTPELAEKVLFLTCELAKLAKALLI